MLTLHGKAYHRIFDLQEQYTDFNVNNSARFYIYDSEFVANASSLELNIQFCNILRSHINTNIRWAQDYRSAVDDILNTLDNNDPNGNVPFIEFAEVSRTTDGPVMGDTVSAPEIAALLYTSGQQTNGSRTVVTYSRNSPDSNPDSCLCGVQRMKHCNFPSFFYMAKPVGEKETRKRIHLSNRRL